MPSSTSDRGALHVSVRLYSVLRHRDGGIVDRIDLALPAGSRAADVLRELDVADGLDPVVAVNDRVVDASAPLSDGDCVSIIPAVPGG